MYSLVANLLLYSMAGLEHTTQLDQWCTLSDPLSFEKALHRQQQLYSVKLTSIVCKQL